MLSFKPVCFALVKMLSYKYRNSHYKDKAVVRLSYIYNGNHVYGKAVFISKPVAESHITGAGTWIARWPDCDQRDERVPPLRDNGGDHRPYSLTEARTPHTNIRGIWCPRGHGRAAQLLWSAADDPCCKMVAKIDQHIRVWTKWSILCVRHIQAHFGKDICCILITITLIS